MQLAFNDETVKHLIDAFSIATIVGALVNVLPSIAAVFSIAWTLLRIYETKTVQGWLRHWRTTHKDQANG